MSSDILFERPKTPKDPEKETTLFPVISAPPFQSCMAGISLLISLNSILFPAPFFLNEAQSGFFQAESACFEYISLKHSQYWQGAWTLQKGGSLEVHASPTRKKTMEEPTMKQTDHQPLITVVTSGIQAELSPKEIYAVYLDLLEKMKTPDPANPNLWSTEMNGRRIWGILDEAAGPHGERIFTVLLPTEY